MLWVLIRIASAFLHKNIFWRTVGTHLNRLTEVILMSTHNICFYEKLTKIILELSSNTHLIWYSEKSSSASGLPTKNFHCYGFELK